MDIRFYNSLSRKVETFVPIKENEVSIYVCGPTVYNDPHIGNMRPAVFFDTLNRFFVYLEYNVKYVSNFTDVDDKIINKAIEEGTDEKTISERYIKSYVETLNDLNVLPSYKNPRVTEYMPQIISYIECLVDKGNAYVNDNEVFFDVHSIPEYGELSNTKIDELVSGARIETNNKKKSPLDFLLWKNTDKGIKWHTRWCEGRPGWHTECCVMIDSIFGGHIDIHGGGMDLKFPHHENEIAQTMAMHGTHLANYWIHTAMMNINGDKMSKSLGNVVLAKDAIKTYGGDVIRLFLLNASYRSIINLNDDTINDTKAIYSKIITIYKQLNLLLGTRRIPLKGHSLMINPFLDCLKDDINIPNAITYLLDIVKKANQEIRNKNSSNELLKEYFYTLNDGLWVLGLNVFPRIYQDEEILLYNNYLKAKEDKNFQLSDKLREELIKKNIL